MERKRYLLALLASAAAACAALRGSQNRVYLEERGVRFFSDLGPETIDVSSYPAEQQRRYRVYARACSQCHGLARSVNSPVVSRDFWELYVSAMRRRSYFVPGEPMPAEEAEDIVAFLDYDDHARKLAHQAEFDARTAELKRRFNELIDQAARERR